MSVDIAVAKKKSTQIISLIVNFWRNNSPFETILRKINTSFTEEKNLHAQEKPEPKYMWEMQNTALKQNRRGLKMFSLILVCVRLFFFSWKRCNKVQKVVEVLPSLSVRKEHSLLCDLPVDQEHMWPMTHSGSGTWPSIQALCKHRRVSVSAWPSAFSIHLGKKMVYLGVGCRKGWPYVLKQNSPTNMKNWEFHSLPL